LLARLKALNQVTAGDSTVATAHWLLFLLFVCMEVLPVAAKLLSTLGPASLYDRRAEREDERADGAARISAGSRSRDRPAEANARRIMAGQRAYAQIEAGRAANQALTDQ